jgi:hypothetical protein
MRSDYQPEMESCCINVRRVSIYDTVVLEARWLLIDEALAVLRKKNASTSDKLKI